MKLKTTILAILTISIIISGCISQMGSKETIYIGTMPFNEQYILANMVGIILEEQGYKTEVLEAGSQNYAAIESNKIQIAVDYSGTMYNVIFKLPALETWDPDIVYDESVKKLDEKNIKTVGKLGFRNDYAIAVKKEFSEKNNISKISDLNTLSSEMSLGTDYIFATRPDGLPRIEELYGINFKSVMQMEPTLMYVAIENDEVDSITAFTTDARIELFDLNLLEDDKNSLPPYDAMILVRGELIEQNPEIEEILSEIVGKIDTEDMRAMNYQYDVEKREAFDIAKEFLINEGIIEN
ncbi:glycine betaine ABC transporter substrate-binding protein [Methanococcus maripaludis]|uniref:Osmoprotectant transport system substrate-binding protein n=1 Tax=Methanococcus maripaludis TaxID=39152 RepID=A0A7J9PMQ9_METMI|nr:glycine betaine ABC transporter substrate-binding protein [Methanococcus maripaludis]MBA2864010.1 osmoprotectant transport system substrate-binding protein [Methanococcus maripaludis]MBB6496024.1 osmoprotectant transport system substrate-binding protein [Methanococcus maripaludis]